MKSDKKCNNCNANKQILNGKFIVKPPPLLLIKTVLSSFDGSGKVIKTLFDVPLILDICKCLKVIMIVRSKYPLTFRV